MPGRLFLTTPLSEVAATLGAALDLLAQPPRRNIQPGQEIAVVVPGSAVRAMRWGLVPVGRVNARGRPVMETIVNARGETVFDKSAFAGLRRGVVPADGWYEWTGAVRRKTAWRISRVDAAPLFFAAIWDVWTAPGGRELLQAATVTCEPSEDVRPIHDRMGVILTPDAVPIWLEGSETEARALVRPLPAGTLKVAEATDVDWSGP
jgi:putative SOS response-associated peptidase YedK